MNTLRRLAHSPNVPPRVAAWRYELLTLGVLAGGLAGLLTGAY